MPAAKVLVTAATQHGATADVAMEIGDELARHGCAVTVLPPALVGDVAEYDAAVIGSALYTGHWLDPAVEFIERNCAALASRPVWLFSSGPVGDPASRLARSMRHDPVEIAPIEAVLGARGHRIFAGRLDAGHLSRGQRASLLVFHGLKGDFRDWGEIRQWARMIANELSGAAAATTDT